MVHEGYYFNPAYAVFREDATVYCLEKYQVALKRPIRINESGWQMEGEDLKGLLSILPTTCDDWKTLAEGEYYRADDILKQAGFTTVREGSCLVVPLREGDFPTEEQLLADLKRRRKEPGDYYGTYWHVGTRRWAPYRLYLPRAYQPDGANRLVVGLHGGGGSPDSIFVHSGERIKEYAEQDGYILLAPDGVTRNSTYGCVLPPAGMKGADLDYDCPENPLHLTERELNWIYMGEIGLTQILAEIREDYSVDAGQIYLMGNSMGGMGTLYYASRYPEVFRKISPAGALPDMRLFDFTPLRHVPTFFVAGEKDFHGVEFMAEGCRRMQAEGIPLIYREVPDGTHGSAWVDVIDEIFSFFRN